MLDHEPALPPAPVAENLTPRSVFEGCRKRVMRRLHFTSIISNETAFQFMFDTVHRPARDPKGPRVGIVSTFPPTRCGIARFSSALVSSLGEVAPDIDVDLVRLIDGRPPTSALGQVGMEIDPNSSVSIRAAARHLDRCDVVILQHEYGIFGDNDGESVLELVDSIDRPLITVVHTVVGPPERSPASDHGPSS